MKYQHIAWDFDGTLYNSYSHIIYCLTEGLRSLGITDSQENITRLAHLSLGDSYAHYSSVSGIPVEELRKAYRKQVIAMGISPRIVPYPGIPELLRDIVAAGGRNHICSNRTVAGCRGYLQRDGLEQYFDVFACPDSREGLRAKPEKDMVALILEERNLTPDAMIMVGDRNLDHEAAHAAGVAGVFFDPDGFAVISCSPEYVAENIDALREILLG